MTEKEKNNSFTKDQIKNYIIVGLAVALIFVGFSWLKGGAVTAPSVPTVAAPSAPSQQHQ